MGARTEEQARPCRCPAGHPWAGLRPLWASLLEALQGPPRLSWEQTLFGLEGAPPPGEGGSTIPACALPLPQSKAGHGLWAPPCGPKRAWAQVTGLSGLPDAAGSQQGGELSAEKAHCCSAPAQCPCTPSSEGPATGSHRGPQARSILGPAASNRPTLSAANTSAGTGGGGWKRAPPAPSSLGAHTPLTFQMGFFCSFQPRGRQSVNHAASLTRSHRTGSPSGCPVVPLVPGLAGLREQFFQPP